MAAAVYSVLRLWHVPAKSPLLLPPATGLWGCMVAVQTQFHAPASAQSLLARRMLLPAETVVLGCPS